MVSSKTVPLSFGRELQGSSKLRPVDFSSHETCFSQARLDHKYNEFILSHLHTLASKDKNIQELILHLEAKRIQDAEGKIEAAMKEYFHEEAARVKKSFEASE